MTGGSLAGVPVAYCDSLEALQRARAEGLSKAARVRTASPVVYDAGLPGVERLEDTPHKVDLADYWQAASDLTRSVHSALERRPATARSALLASRSALSFHRAMQKATTLASDDFSEPRAGLLVATGSAGHDAILNAPWSDYFAGHNRYFERRYPVRANQAVTDDANWLQKWRRLTWSRLVYAGLIRLSDPLGALTGCRVLVFRENELVEDVVRALAIRGYAAQRLRSPVPEDANVSSEVDDVSDAARPAVQNFLDRWFTPEVHGAAWPMFRRTLTDNLQTYAATRVAWLKELEPYARGRAVMLTNFPGGADAISLADSCRKLGIPVVAAQHGVTREISAAHGPIEVFFENGVADLFLVFNEAARRISDASPFARGSSHAVGMPGAYSRSGIFRRRNRRFPILYVSTALMKGNINLATGGASDIKRFQREVALLEHVLGRLPHEILFKSYPSRDRYLGEDPLHRRIANYKNVTLFNKHIDLRYFASEHDVLIASRATSTIGWCLMANRPLVLVDYGDDSPLSAQVRPHFEAGLFLFDWNAPGMFDDLRAFLSQPLAKIRDQWKAKGSQREKLMRNFLSSHSTGAGERSARAIIDLRSMRENSGIEAPKGAVAVDKDVG